MSKNYLTAFNHKIANVIEKQRSVQQLIVRENEQASASATKF